MGVVEWESYKMSIARGGNTSYVNFEPVYPQTVTMYSHGFPFATFDSYLAML